MLGKRIANLRRKKNISQTELADALNITRSALSQYEIDRCEPSLSLILKMSDIFNVSVDFLLEHHSKNKSQFSEDEKQLLKMYRLLNIKKQEEVLNFIKYTLQNSRNSTPPPQKL